MYQASQLPEKTTNNSAIAIMHSAAIPILLPSPRNTPANREWIAKVSKNRRGRDFVHRKILANSPWGDDVSFTGQLLPKGFCEVNALGYQSWHHRVGHRRRIGYNSSPGGRRAILF